MTRLLPHPLLSLALWFAWLALHNSVAPGQVVLGALLAWALPLSALRLVEGRWPRLRRPGRLMRLGATVLYDIVAANIEVARRILGPEAAIRPGFVRVPIDLADDWAITALGGIITMTPGTLTADVAPDRSFLLVHALHVDDEAALVASIKTRYEAPLRAIFE
jgi:multicomponent K+:H+ antiporter subunit E